MTNQVPTFQEIVMAIQTKDENVIAKLQSFINARANNINAADQNAVTLLHYAAESGHVEAVRFLLANGAKSWGIKNDVKIGTVDAIQGYTPLHLAAQNGHRDIVQYLLNAGFDATARTRWRSIFRGDTPAEVATDDEIKRLINNSRRYNVNSIMRDLEDGNLETAIQKIKDGVCLSGTDFNGNSIGNIAASCGNEDVWQELLSTGINLNFRNQYGRTPLHIAIESQSTEVLSLMVESGANLNIQDNKGNTPLVSVLSLPREFNSEENVLFLIDKGADVCLPNKDGLTALHYASYKGNMTIIQELVTHGADVNAKSNQGTTPLHEAVANDNLNVVVYLLNHGADISLPNAEERRAIEMITQNITLQQARNQGSCSADSLGIKYVLNARQEANNASEMAYYSLKEALENRHFVTANQLVRIYKEQNVQISTEREQELLALVGNNEALKRGLSEISFLEYIPSEESAEERRIRKIEVPPVELNLDPVIPIQVDVQTTDVLPPEDLNGLLEGVESDEVVGLENIGLQTGIDSDIDFNSESENSVLEEGQSAILSDTPVVENSERERNLVEESTDVLPSDSLDPKPEQDSVSNSQPQVIPAPADREAPEAERPIAEDNPAPANREATAPEHPTTENNPVPANREATAPEHPTTENNPAPADRSVPTPESSTTENNPAPTDSPAPTLERPTAEGTQPNAVSPQGEQQNQVQVIRHQYGDLGEDESRIDHSEVLDFANGRNRERLDHRRRGRRNRNRPTPYQTAISNIRRMEEMGLLPKGPNGESNADVYLYRLYQAREFYHPQEYLMIEGGEYRRVSDLFRSSDGKSLNRVYSNLIARELSDNQLRSYAVTILTAERCIDNKGHDRAHHRGRILDRFSYRPGATNDVEETRQNVQQKLNETGEVVPEYTAEGISQDRRVAFISTDGKMA
ncbi:MAG: ankyrin repeat domain-containing protein [Alphaproteobacteria bacterium]|nr:ankyrin repeat domain-containing protein [Alphaproteobacteria bacterium]